MAVQATYIRGIEDERSCGTFRLSLSGSWLRPSLVPRPLPDFILQLWRKIGGRPGTITVYVTDRKWWTRFRNDGSTMCGRYKRLSLPRRFFSSQLRDKIWEWPGNEASKGQGTKGYSTCTCIHCIHLNCSL